MFFKVIKYCIFWTHQCYGHAGNRDECLIGSECVRECEREKERARECERERERERERESICNRTKEYVTE